MRFVEIGLGKSGPNFRGLVLRELDRLVGTELMKTNSWKGKNKSAHPFCVDIETSKDSSSSCMEVLLLVHLSARSSTYAEPLFRCLLYQMRVTETS